MPINEILAVKSKQDIVNNTKLKLAINCAPILKGSKAAHIITVSLQEFNIIKELLKGTGISCYLLRGKYHSFNLYLYRRDMIETYLAGEDVKDFLKIYGYETGNFPQMLVRLSERSKEFCNNANEFPHEIGVFLEYPLGYVKGFIENKGKNSLYAGYWKVYMNWAATRRLFERFDEEREQVVRQILDGASIREVMV